MNNSNLLSRFTSPQFCNTVSAKYVHGNFHTFLAVPFIANTTRSKFLQFKTPKEITSRITFIISYHFWFITKCQGNCKYNCKQSTVDTVSLSLYWAYIHSYFHHITILFSPYHILDGRKSDEHFFIQRVIDANFGFITSANGNPVITNSI